MVAQGMILKGKSEFGDELNQKAMKAHRYYSRNDYKFDDGSSLDHTSDEEEDLAYTSKTSMVAL